MGDFEGPSPIYEGKGQNEIAVTAMISCSTRDTREITSSKREY